MCRKREREREREKEWGPQMLSTVYLQRSTVCQYRLVLRVDFHHMNRRKC